MPNYCEQCGTVQDNTKAKVCDSCGHAHGAKPTKNNAGQVTPATLRPHLLQILRHYEPDATAQDIDALLAMLEPEHPWERPQQHTGRDNTTRTRWPYADRMEHLVHRYGQADGELRRLIHSAHEDQIPWRGDPLDKFLNVISATLDWREATPATRQTARAALTELRKNGIKSQNPP